MELVEMGLLIIALAWVVQLAFMLKGKKEISVLFILIYVVGALLLVANAYSENGIGGSKFELATLVTSALVLLKALKK